MQAPAIKAVIFLFPTGLLFAIVGLVRFIEAQKYFKAEIFDRGFARKVQLQALASHSLASKISTSLAVLHQCVEYILQVWFT